MLARACPVSVANALGMTLTAPPHASQVDISISPKAPTFGTAERDQPILVASAALHSKKSMFQSTTFQERIKFFFYMEG